MPGLRRRSRKSNKDSQSHNGSSSSTVTTTASASTAVTAAMDNALFSTDHSHSTPRTRSMKKHLTLKRLKSSNAPSFTAPPLPINECDTELEIIMKEDASEDLNDLKNLLFNDDTNDSTISNTMTSHHDNHNNNNNLYHMTNSNSTSLLKKEDESKIKRMTTRLISGWLMVGTFVGTMYLGHIYMCTLIFLVEVALVSNMGVSPSIHILYCKYSHSIILHNSFVTWFEQDTIHSSIESKKPYLSSVPHNGCGSSLPYSTHTPILQWTF